MTERHLILGSGYALTECGLTEVRPDRLTTDPDERTCRACRDALIRKGTCPACLSARDVLEWGTHPRNMTGVADGRLTMRDVETIFYLACSFCSETLIPQLSPDEVARALTTMGWVPGNG